MLPRAGNPPLLRMADDIRIFRQCLEQMRTGYPVRKYRTVDNKDRRGSLDFNIDFSSIHKQTENGDWGQN